MMIHSQEIECRMGDDGEEAVGELRRDFLPDGPFEGNLQLRDPLLRHQLPLPSHNFPTDILVANERREEERERGAITRQKREITFEDVSKFFYSPISVAAKELKMGVTQLRAKCRELGIPEWPQKKLNSLKTLVRRVEILGRGKWKADGWKVPRVRARLEREMKAIERTPGIPPREETVKLRQSCTSTVFKRRKVNRLRASSSSGN